MPISSVLLLLLLLQVEGPNTEVQAPRYLPAYISHTDIPSAKGPATAVMVIIDLIITT